MLGGPLKRAQDITAKYLLELEPDRMLAYYRIRAGLPQKAEPYAGWDGGGRNLTGHIAGHYLSAVSLMYLATGDPRLKQRADHVVRELQIVQDKHGDGYLSALEGGREAFAALSKGDIRSAAFDLNGLWSPWYTLHKTFAGLRDAHRHAGNQTALRVETKFATWVEGVLAPLDDAQIARMLNAEHGGMNEVLADLYADTGDRRWLDLSYRFEHHELTDALKRHQDNLNGKHGNCQIPKLIGSAARYACVGDAGDLMAASFFWDRVTQHHSYATGGHGLAVAMFRSTARRSSRAPYVNLRRTWKSGGTVEITFRKSVRVEPTLDRKTVTAIMWGPLALASDHGPRVEGRGETADDFRATGVARVPGEPGMETDVTLTPFYRTHGRRDSIYVDLITPSELSDRETEIAVERERVRRLEAATLGFVQPGDADQERQFNYQSDPADRAVQQAAGRASRAGTGWFSFDMPVDGSSNVAVVVTDLNDVGLPPASGNFEIIVDGTSIGRFEPNGSAVGFYDARYAVPAESTRGKTKVTARFQASQGGRIAPVFGVRTIRSTGA